MQIKEQRFKALFLSESGRMYKAAYILLGDEDEAKDVVQDIFAKLWTGTIPLKEESQRTYLLTCVRNRCLNIIAHRQTQQEAIRLLTPEAIAEENHDDEIVEMVNRYVDEKLSPQTSRIIKMHFDASSRCTSTRTSRTRISPVRWASVCRQSTSTSCRV